MRFAELDLRVRSGGISTKDQPNREASKAEVEGNGSGGVVNGSDENDVLD
jgi:hypothetical protein